LENPGKPWLTPHWMKPFERTASTVGPASAAPVVIIDAISRVAARFIVVSHRHTTRRCSEDCAVFATHAQRFAARSRHLLETNHFSV
jgi:hypothetical protein